MGKGYKLTLGIITIMILITISIGTSYSYYSITDSQESENNLATACFDVEFTESDTINLSHAYPMTAETAIGDGTNGKVVPYKFTIRNTCSNTTINYVVTLSPLISEDDLTNYIDYNIVETTSSSDKTSHKLSEATTYELPAQYKNGLAETYQLATGTLTGSASKSYNLYLWIDDAATIDIQGKSFTGKVYIYTYV